MSRRKDVKTKRVKPRRRKIMKLIKQAKQILEQTISQVMGALITAAILTWMWPKPQPMSISPTGGASATSGVLATFTCWFIVSLILIHAIKRYIERWW